ncbi:hypothetical protein LCGC14_3112160 [marine sediment metagenome]|uniref:Uncharacterized protein n=1 Tax=marine sediment metagenome TaxID=412755 RepID=A0A0F8YUP3_9ZZZZ
MTEQEEAVGRQRIKVLDALQKRLIELDTEATVLYPTGNERHARAQTDRDELASIIGRLEADPSILPVRLLDAEKRVTTANEKLVAAQTEATEAQAALDALKTP